MSKRKIVFLGATGSVSLTGGFRIIAGYADRLQSRGYDVAIVAPGGAPRKPKTFLQRVRGWLRGVFSKPPKSALVDRPFLKNPDVRIDIVPGKNALSPEDIPQADVLIATWWETAEWAHAAGARAAKCHLVQDHEVFPYLPQDRVRAAYRLPLRKIVVSQWLQQEMRSAYGVDDAVLIENAIDADWIEAAGRRRDGPPTAGFLYSPAARKNCALAVAACEVLKKRMPDLRAVAFGGHAPPSSFKMPSWIEFSHAPDQAAIRDIYSRCGVWLFTSDEEGFGLPILEAMARGTPVVATRAGAAPQLVTPENGALAESRAEAVADAAQRILELPDAEWRRMSDAALATARRRNWEDATDQLERVLARVMDDAAAQEGLTTG